MAEGATEVGREREEENVEITGGGKKGLGKPNRLDVAVTGNNQGGVIKFVISRILQRVSWCARLRVFTVPATLACV